MQLSQHRHTTPWRHAITVATLLIAGTAQAEIQLDPVTGQAWSLFDNVADGQAQGYRAATVEEFRTLLTHATWRPRAGATDVYDYTTDGKEIPPGAIPENPTNLYFGEGVLAPEPVDLGGNILVKAGWLQAEGGAPSALGLVELYTNSHSDRYGLFKWHKNMAEIASAADLNTKFAATAFPSTYPEAAGYYPLTYNPVTGYRGTDGTITAPTFMISGSVPEPTSALLMLLGLGGVAMVTTTRKTAAAK